MEFSSTLKLDFFQLRNEKKFRKTIYVFHVFLATVLLQSKIFLVCGKFQKQLFADVIKNRCS